MKYFSNIGGKSKKVLLAILLPLFLISSILIFPGCNNPENKQSNNSNSKADTLVEAGNQSLAAWNGNFPYLGIPIKTIDSLFLTVKCKKIVFKFQFDTAGAAPSLVAYGIKQKKYIDVIPQYTLAKSSLSHNLTGEIYLGDLELPDSIYKELKKDPSYGTSTHLIFDPVLSGTYPKSVIYHIGWGNFSTKGPLVILSVTEDLNPSPPAKPADDN